MLLVAGDWDVEFRIASVTTVNRKQMGSTTFGDTDRVNWARLAAPQDIEIDRGNSGRVRVSDRV
jgi:hypothetical protein